MVSSRSGFKGMDCFAENRFIVSTKQVYRFYKTGLSFLHKTSLAMTALKIAGADGHIVFAHDDGSIV